MKKEREEMEESDECIEEITFIYHKKRKTTKSIMSEGCRYFNLSDILWFVGVPVTRRRRVSVKGFLSEEKIKWIWFRPTGQEFSRFIHLGDIEKYIYALVKLDLITSDIAWALDIWLGGLAFECESCPKSRASKILKKKTERKRKRKRSDASGEDDAEEESADNNNNNNNSNDTSDEEEYSSVESIAEAEIQNVERVNVTVNIAKRQRLMKLSTYVIASGAEILRMLPSEDTKQKACVLAEMLNHFEILKALHPLRNPTEPANIRKFPPTGSQVRVSDRIRAYGIDPKSVKSEKYMRIGGLAAQKFRSHYGISPWNVPVWVGDERKSTHFYTESTCVFIDEAIEKIFEEEEEGEASEE